MNPKLVERIKVALAAAQEHKRLHPSRHVALCVNHLEDALLRALLVLGGQAPWG